MMDSFISRCMFPRAISDRKETFLYHFSAKAGTYAGYSFSIIYFIFFHEFTSRFFYQWTSFLLIISVAFSMYSLIWFGRRFGYKGIPYGNILVQIKNLFGGALIFVSILAIYMFFIKNVDMSSINVGYVFVFFLWPCIIISLSSSSILSIIISVYGILKLLFSLPPQKNI